MTHEVVAHHILVSNLREQQLPGVFDRPASQDVETSDNLERGGYFWNTRRILVWILILHAGYLQPVCPSAPNHNIEHGCIHDDLDEMVDSLLAFAPRPGGEILPFAHKLVHLHIETGDLGDTVGQF